MASELSSVSPPTSPVYRVGRGPDPLRLREWADINPSQTFGNRFDDPGPRHGLPVPERYRTAYFATHSVGAYGETIARFRKSLNLLAALESVDDDEPITPFIGRGALDPAWRTGRALGRLKLDRRLRFVDLEDIGTLQELRRATADVAVRLGMHEVDASSMKHDRREFTQEVSRYIYERQEPDGEPSFAGIRYLSRLGPNWELWAVFEGRYEQHSADLFPRWIRPDDEGLVEAAGVLDITLPH